MKKKLRKRRGGKRRAEIIEEECESRGAERCGQLGRGRREEKKMRAEEDAVRSQGQPQGQLSQ